MGCVKAAWRSAKPPDVPTTVDMTVVWKGPTSMLRSLNPPKYGRASATSGSVSDAVIVSVMKSWVIKFTMSVVRARGEKNGMSLCLAS